MRQRSRVMLGHSRPLGGAGLSKVGTLLPPSRVPFSWFVATDAKKASWQLGAMPNRKRKPLPPKRSGGWALGA
jgi:hypothetical protein